jgi:hypothetical protein
VLAIPHKELLDISEDEFLNKLEDNGLMIDIKEKLNKQNFELKEKKYWCL